MVLSDKNLPILFCREAFSLLSEVHVALHCTVQ